MRDIIRQGTLPLFQRPQDHRHHSSGRLRPIHNTHARPPRCAHAHTRARHPPIRCRVCCARYRLHSLAHAAVLPELASRARSPGQRRSLRAALHVRSRASLPGRCFPPRFDATRAVLFRRHAVRRASRCCPRAPASAVCCTPTVLWHGPSPAAGVATSITRYAGCSRRPLA